MKWTRVASTVFGGVTAMTTGCWVLVGLEDRPVAEAEAGADAGAPIEETASSADAGEDTAPVVMPDGAVCRCLPGVPAGWEGPLVVDELADCAAPWNAAAELVHGALDSGVHNCACACNSPATTCLMTEDYMAGCNSGACGGQFALVPGQCQMRGSSCASFLKYTIDGGGPCVAAPTKRVDPVGWGRDARICKTGTVDTCNGSAPCVPERPASAGYCISHAGDMPCPPSYPLQRTYYDHADDTRTCTACNCSDGGAPCEVGYYSAANCNEVDRLATQYPPYCYSVLSTATYLKLNRGAPGCIASGGAKTGAVTPIGQRTVCCRSD